MGIWGTGLYDSDSTADIRDSFRSYLDQGLSPVAAKDRVTNEFQEMLRDPDEGPLVMLALAEQLMLVNALTSSERNAALNYIRNGGDLENWQKGTTEFDNRKLEFERIANTLMACTTNASWLKTKRKKQFDWQIGQVYALPICSDIADALSLRGEYFLLYFWGEGETIKGYRTPLVWAKVTKNGAIPQTVAEFNNLEYVQIACTAMEDRFTPVNNESELPHEYRQKYIPDQWGYLPEFTMHIYESKGNHPPKTMFPLIPFEDIKPPKNNYHRYRSSHGAAWRYLEEYLIQGYRLHNLREAAFYSK